MNNKVQGLFEAHFKHSASVVCHAPGRVNLIGDHTDYNDGFVLPAAINFGTDIAASKREDNVVKVVAYDINQEQVTFPLSNIEFDTEHSWSNYVRGVLKMLLLEFPQINGAEVMVTGNVPQGAGLSSSASFEIAVIKAFTELYQLPMDGVKAALIGQTAENNFVGCSCGIMDQLISAMGKENHAMLLDCRSLTFKDAPLPTGMAVLIVNSNVKRGLVDSEYNLRREQCESVAKHFKRKALRDVSFTELEEQKIALDSTLYRRARHVITENNRTQEALKCLLKSDVTRLSKLMAESHQSLKDDFEVTTPEMDFLADILNEKLGSEGGARMTGGGFGGCVVAIVPEQRADELIKDVTKAYQDEYKLSASFYSCRLTSGAFRKQF
ncbi:galactokinase [Shewanella sp. OPT22]|nr:galactokinase [Shewanella sp. OPT22]